MMEKTLNTLFIIASTGLAISAMIFSSIAIFCDTKLEWILPAGLFCCVLSTLFNLLRSMLSKTSK